MKLDISPININTIEDTLLNFDFYANLSRNGNDSVIIAIERITATGVVSYGSL